MRVMPFLACISVLFFFSDGCSVAQIGAQTTDRRTNDFLLAMQKREIRRLLDMTFGMQAELGRIRTNQPKVLWNKLIDQSYQEIILAFQQTNTSELEKIRVNALSMGGDSRLALAQMLPFIPASATWKISEIRRDRPNLRDDVSGAPPPKSVETAYIVVTYPNSREAPIVQGARLRQALISIRLRDGLIDDMSRLDKGDVELPGSRDELARERASAYVLSQVADGHPNFDEIKKALALADNVNLRDQKGNTPLILLYANTSPYADLGRYFRSNLPLPEILQLFRNHGADVNAKNNIGASALGYAAYLGKVEGVKTLLSLGAEVNTQNVSGETPLLLAVHAAAEKLLATNDPTRCGEYLEIVTTLIKAGGNPNLANANGITAVTKLRDIPLLAGEKPRPQSSCSYRMLQALHPNSSPAIVDGQTQVKGQLDREALASAEALDQSAKGLQSSNIYAVTQTLYRISRQIKVVAQTFPEQTTEVKSEMFKHVQQLEGNLANVPRQMISVQGSVVLEGIKKQITIIRSGFKP